MGLQLQIAVKNGQRFVKYRYMRAATTFRSQFRPPVGAIDYKRFEETKTFQVMKEMSEKRGIKVSVNPRSQCRNDRLCVPTSSILCMQHDFDVGRINGMELLHKIKHILDEYSIVKILDNAKINYIGMSKVI
jgi:hypothetical protein